MLVLLLLVLQPQDMLYSSVKNLKVGDVATLASPKTLESKQPKTNLVLSSRVYISDLIKYVRAKDQFGLEELRNKGITDSIETGSQIKILELFSHTSNGKALPFMEFRVLDGKHKGKKFVTFQSSACEKVDLPKP